jgi:hypothetical protein
MDEWNLFSLPIGLSIGDRCVSTSQGLYYSELSSSYLGTMCAFYPCDKSHESQSIRVGYVMCLKRNAVIPVMVAKVVAKLIYHKKLPWREKKKHKPTPLFDMILPFPFYCSAFLRFRERRRFLRGVSSCSASSLMARGASTGACAWGEGATMGEVNRTVRISGSGALEPVGMVLSVVVGRAVVVLDGAPSIGRVSALLTASSLVVSVLAAALLAAAFLDEALEDLPFF